MNNLKTPFEIVISCAVLFCLHARADDCEFIRAGLRNLPASGGEVIVPPGNYRCDKPIVLDHDNTQLRGEGTVLLSLADNINAPVIVMGDIQTPPRSTHHLRVENIQIDGNRKHQQIECWGGPCDSGETSFIRNNGISVRATVDSSIQNVTVKAARSGGIVSERNTSHLTIDGLNSSDNEFDGYAACETTDSDFSHMNLHDNQAAGISTDMQFNRNNIHDSQLTHNGDVGIFMRASSHNIYKNLVISECGNHGVFAAWVDGITTCTLDNEFQNLTVTGSKGFGFLLNNACRGNKLSGEVIFKRNRDGCVKNIGSEPISQPDQIICTIDLKFNVVSQKDFSHF